MNHQHILTQFLTIVRRRLSSAKLAAKQQQSARIEHDHGIHNPTTRREKKEPYPTNYTHLFTSLTGPIGPRFLRGRKSNFAYAVLLPCWLFFIRLFASDGPSLQSSSAPSSTLDGTSSSSAAVAELRFDLPAVPSFTHPDGTCPDYGFLTSASSRNKILTRSDLPFSVKKWLPHT